MEDLKEVFNAVAQYFSLLAEPTRLRILHAICQEEKSVSEIVALTGISQTNASRHLNMMHHSGMLSRRKDGNSVLYRVADQVFVDLCRAVCVHVTTQMDSPTPLRKELETFLEDTSGANPSTEPLKEDKTRVRSAKASSRPGPAGA
jgi:DNA-binding transcriptional ArsR family regulator